MNTDHMDSLLGRKDLAWCAGKRLRDAHGWITPFVVHTEGFVPGVLRSDGTAVLASVTVASRGGAIDQAEWAASIIVSSGMSALNDHRVLDSQDSALIWRMEPAPGSGDNLIPLVLRDGELFQPRLLLPNGHLRVFASWPTRALAQESALLERQRWLNVECQSEPPADLQPEATTSRHHRVLGARGKARQERNARQAAYHTLLDSMAQVLAWRGEPVHGPRSSVEPFVLRDHGQFRPCLLMADDSISTFPAVPSFELACEHAADEAARWGLAQVEALQHADAEPLLNRSTLLDDSGYIAWIGHVMTGGVDMVIPQVMHQEGRFQPRLILTDGSFQTLGVKPTLAEARSDSIRAAAAWLIDRTQHSAEAMWPMEQSA